MPTSRRRLVRRSLAAITPGLFLLGLAVGCADRDLPTTTSDRDAREATHNSATSGALLRCDPLPAARAEARIGPEGGTLQVGPHTFVVPAGALTEAVTITAEAPSESVNSVEFGPAGLRFAPDRPARLTLSYANCPGAGQSATKRVAYTDDMLKVLQLLPSVDEVGSKRVSASIQHFSRFAVAW